MNIFLNTPYLDRDLDNITEDGEARVARIAGNNIALDDLNDVVISGPTTGQALVYDGGLGAWKNAAGGGGSSTLAGLADVAISTPANLDLLTYNSGTSKWTNVASLDQSQVTDLESDLNDSVLIPRERELYTGFSIINFGRGWSYETSATPKTSGVGPTFWNDPSYNISGLPTTSTPISTDSSYFPGTNIPSTDNYLYLYTDISAGEFTPSTKIIQGVLKLYAGQQLPRWYINGVLNGLSFTPPDPDSPAPYMYEIVFEGTQLSFIFGTPPNRIAIELARTSSSNPFVFNMAINYFPTPFVEDLLNVATASSANGNILIYNSGTGNWVPSPQSALSVPTTYAALTDVQLTSLSDKQHTYYDSTATKWVNSFDNYLDATTKWNVNSTQATMVVEPSLIPIFRIGVDTPHTLLEGVQAVRSRGGFQVSTGTTAQRVASPGTQGGVLRYNQDLQRFEYWKGSSFGNVWSQARENLSEQSDVTITTPANKQLLAYDSGTSRWNNKQGLTTKGDVLTYDTDYQRLPVGTNGQVLSANSATATGLQWVTPSSGSSTFASLTDVQLTSLAANDTLFYNNATSRWNNFSGVKVGTGTYSIQYDSLGNFFTFHDGTTGRFFVNGTANGISGTNPLTSTGAFYIPTSTTANRPAAPVGGCIRINTSVSPQALEYYDTPATTWRQLSPGGAGYTSTGNTFGADSVLGLTDNFTMRLTANNNEVAAIASQQNTHFRMQNKNLLGSNTYYNETQTTTDMNNGLCIAMDYPYLYCAGVSTTKIETFFINNKFTPVLKATLNTTLSPLWLYTYRKLLFAHNVLTNMDLVIYDISDPINITQLSVLPVTVVKSFVCDGTFLYTVGEIRTNVHIFDISDPTAPVQVSVISGIAAKRSVTVRGDYLYAVGNDLQIWDIKNKAAPVSKSITSIPSTVTADFLSQAWYGNLLFACQRTTNEIFIFDVSNSAAPITSPVAAGYKITIDSFTTSSNVQIIIDGDHLYMGHVSAAATKRFIIYDLTTLVPGTADSATRIFTGPLITNANAITPPQFVKWANFIFYINPDGGSGTQAIRVVELKSAAIDGARINNLFVGNLQVDGNVRMTGQLNSTVSVSSRTMAATYLTADRQLILPKTTTANNTQIAQRGSIYYDTTDNELKFRDATQFKTLVSSPAVTLPTAYWILDFSNNASLLLSGTAINQITTTGTGTAAVFSAAGGTATATNTGNTDNVLSFKRQYANFPNTSGLRYVATFSSALFVSAGQITISALFMIIGSNGTGTSMEIFSNLVSTSIGVADTTFRPQFAHMSAGGTSTIPIDGQANEYLLLTMVISQNQIAFYKNMDAPRVIKNVQPTFSGSSQAYIGNNVASTAQANANIAEIRVYRGLALNNYQVNTLYNEMLNKWML